MKKLTIKTKESSLTIEDGNYRGRKAVLNIGYPEQNTYCGKYLTDQQAWKLYEWLGGWLKEAPTTKERER